jgi:hypothetical protein
MSMRPHSRNTRYKKEISTYHGENPHVLVCKLVAEESGKSDIVDSTLSGGLCGVVPASGSGVSCDCCNRHSATEGNAGMYAASGGVLFGNVTTALLALALGTTCSCVVASTPSVSVFDDESPSRGLSKVIGGGIGPLFVVASEGDEEKDNWEEVGLPPMSPR